MAIELINTVKISRTLMVSGGGEKTPWSVSTVDVVDGIEFITVCSSQHTVFARFCWGKRGGHGPIARSVFLKDMRHKRLQECLRVVSLADEPQQALFDEEEVKAPAPKRGRGPNAEVAGGTPPEFVTLSLGDLKDQAGKVVAYGIKLKVRSSLDLAAALSLEATPEALNYIRHGIIVSVVPDTAEVPRQPDVRWRPDRGAYVANKISDSGKKTHKTFKAEGDDDASIKVAFALAVEWLCEPAAIVNT